MAKTTTRAAYKPEFPKLVDAPISMAEFKMPSFDISAIMEIQRKNFETIIAINRTVFENLQGLASRQTELLQQGIEQTKNLLDAILAASTAQEKIKRHSEASQQMMGKCMTNACDVAGTIIQCHSEAVKTASSRLNTGIEELHGLLNPTTAA